MTSPPARLPQAAATCAARTASEVLTVTLARAAEAAPAVPRRVSARTVIKIVAAATAVGLLTGLFGVGGGFVIVPALVLALGFEMPIAVGTSLLVIAINSAPRSSPGSAATATSTGRCSRVFVAAAIAGWLAGHRVASRAHPVRLTLAFAILLTGVAAYTASRSIPYLLLAARPNRRASLNDDVPASAFSTCATRRPGPCGSGTSRSTWPKPSPPGEIPLA